MRMFKSAAREDDAAKGIGLSLVALVLVAVLPLLVFGSGVAWMVVDQKKAAVAQELAGIARALRVAVDRELLGQFAPMKMLAADASLDGDHLAQFQKSADQAIKGNSDWLNVGLIDTHSHRILISSPALHSPSPVSLSPDYLDEVVRTRRPLIVGAFPVSPITHGPIILLMSPVIRGNEVRYVLGVAMNPRTLNDIFVEQHLAPTWTGAIVDSHMVLAGRSRDPERYVGKRATESLVSRIANQDSGMFTALTQDGVTVYTTFSRSPLTNWSLAVGVPAAEVEGPIRRTLLQLMATSGALITCALLLAGTVGRVIVRRRKAYELSLKESESRFRVMADSAPVQIWITGLDKLCTWVNKVGLEYTGRTLEQELGGGWAQSVHPEDVERLFKTYGTAFERREPFSIAFRLRRADGQYGWMLNKGIPRYERQLFQGYIGSCTDITDRMQVEEALAKSEERLNLVLHSLDEGVWDWDISSNLTYLSPKYYEIAQCRPQDVVADLNFFISLIHPDDLERVMAAMNERMAGASEMSAFEFRMVTGKGSSKWIWGKGKVVERDACGRPLRMLGTIIDVTERKQAEVALRNSEQRYRALFSGAGEGIFIMSSQGVLIEINDSFARMHGYRVEEMVGMNIKALITRESSASALERMRRILAGESLKFEAEHIHRDGHVFPLEVTISLICVEGETLIQCLHHDISERKRSEEATLKAKIAAESANRAKSEFLANMSHEIRTPMNGIMGMSHLLRYTELTEEQSEYLDDITLSSQSLMSLINDILDLTKIEAGKIELEHHNFSLRASINEVIRTQISLIRSKGLAIRTDIPEEVPDNLVGDQLRLKQILLNVLGNAIKFTERGGIVISASASTPDGDNALLELVVKDTGIGIDPEAIGRIFEPFSQADSSTTRIYGGTGLGLSICTRLTELLGGRIWAESREGEGSAFHVLIPFIVNDQPADGDDDDSEDEASGGWEGKSLQILVADDQVINLKFSEQILKKVGHRVVTAKNGLDALEKWDNGSFDIVLMDIHMPEMNGVLAAQAIRTRESASGRRTPIVALTAFALKGDEQHLLEQGFDGYISKPVQVGALFRELRKFFPESLA